MGEDRLSKGLYLKDLFKPSATVYPSRSVFSGALVQKKRFLPSETPVIFRFPQPSFLNIRRFLWSVSNPFRATLRGLLSKSAPRHF